MQLTKPKALRPGDTIGVVVPASPIDPERIERAFGRVRDLGYQLKTYGDIYRRTGYLAGDDDTRAAELMAAFADPQTSAVWCARGGYGVTRLLNRIDFDTIRHNPKTFVGFSDITLLHVAIQQRAQLITFHGPNLQDGFGKPEPMPSATATTLWQMVSASPSIPTDSLSQPLAGLAQNSPIPYDFTNIHPLDLRTITPGIARGPLTGGNLAVFNSLLGTPFEPDTTGHILFLEDVSERAYRIDRYLSQLTLAGKLQSAAGILLGTFSYDDDEPADTQEAVNEVLNHYCRPLGIPVLAGFPAGHAQYNLALPMGAEIEIDATHHQVQICQPPAVTSAPQPPAPSP